MQNSKRENQLKPAFKVNNDKVFTKVAKEKLSFGKINFKKNWIPKGTIIITNPQGPKQVWVPKLNT